MQLALMATMPWKKMDMSQTEPHWAESYSTSAWVKSGHSAKSDQCPLYPRKRRSGRGSAPIFELINPLFCAYRRLAPISAGGAGVAPIAPSLRAIRVEYD